MHLGDPGLGDSNFTDVLLDNMRTVLNVHSEIDLAVLSGDQIQAINLNTTQLQMWNLLTNELQARGVPHTALIGNHDTMPFSTPNVTDWNDDSLDTYRIHGKDHPGALVSRHELMARDGEGLPDSSRPSAPAMICR